MPKMTGLEAAKIIRTLGFTYPIIGVTGNALEEDKISFLNAGATTVLIKPVNITVLHELLYSKFLYFFIFTFFCLFSYHSYHNNYCYYYCYSLFFY